MCVQLAFLAMQLISSSILTRQRFHMPLSWVSRKTSVWLGITINGSVRSFLHKRKVILTHPTGSIFYFGYLAWEYPTNLLMQRWPLGKYSAFNVITWGSILVLHAAVANFGGAVAARLFLGVFEAAVTPGFALLSM